MHLMTRSNIDFFLMVCIINYKKPKKDSIMNNKLIFTLAAALIFSANASQAQELRGYELAKKLGCATCHLVSYEPARFSRVLPRIGPAWNKIAQRYKNTPNADQILVDSIKYGYKTPKWDILKKNASRVSDKDALQLAKWILEASEATHVSTRYTPCYNLNRQYDNC